MRGQLTGIPRQIKDSVADLYNNIQLWKKLNDIGFEQLTKLSDIKLSLIVPEDEINDISSTTLFSYRYNDALNQVCRELVYTFMKMEMISSELTAMVSKFDKLTELAMFNSELGNNLNLVPFLTWSIDQFSSSVKKIAEMFSKELSVKRCIVENAAHVDYEKPSYDVSCLREECRNILTTYSSCWLHEPYINDSVKSLLLNELLFETGHSV